MAQAGIVVGFVQLIAATASAEDQTSPADTAAARDLAVEGMKLADADHCAQAIDKLVRAEKLRHSAIVLGRLGECRIQVGKFVDGTEDLQRLLHEPLPVNPPPNLLRARERAQTALDAAKPNIAYLAISVRGPVENAVVTIDGQAVPSVLLERDRPTDPGEHLIDASAPGYIKVSRRLTIAAGEKQEITLRLTADPQAAAAPETSPPITVEKSEKPAKVSADAVAPLPPQASDTPQSSTGATVGFVLMGLGGAVLATGGVFGYLALDKKNSLEGQCPNNSCAPSSQDSLDTANRYANISTILMGAGAAVTTLGAIVYFSSGPSSKDERVADTARARAFVGLGQAGIAGTF
jgi:hypothetical protein